MRAVAPLAVLLLVACMKHLPPAATPAEVAPDVGAGAPPARGHDRLVVDVVDGPTTVQRVRMAATSVNDTEGRSHVELVEAREPFCPMSPCYADLTDANVLLEFPVVGSPGSSEVELVHVDPGTSVYRRALSLYDPGGGAGRVLGILGICLGSAAAITGIPLLTTGASEKDGSLAIAGGITLGVGVGMLVVGIIATRATAATFRPGSAVHFVTSPPPAIPALETPPGPADAQ